MIRTSLFFWMGLVLFAMLVNVAAARADCRWQVSGTLEGEAPRLPGDPPRTWILQGTEVRIQTRWANMACPQVGLTSDECPWSTGAWPATITDSQGRFTVLSNGYPDPVCQKDRDFRVEVRGYPVTNWAVVGQQDDFAGPTTMAGPSIPLPRHNVTLDLIRTDRFPEPPVELFPVEEDDKDDRTMRLEPAGDSPWSVDDDNDDAQPHLQMAEVPCGMETLGLNASTEFRFGPFSQTADNVSFDRALMIELRTNGAGQVTLNRIRAHILVQNAGTRGFTPSNRCAARVALRINEGPGERGEGDDAWFETDDDMPAVPANGETPHSDEANLLGAGDVLEGEPWPEDWEYALIEVELDHTGEVFEQAEGDNVIRHCYHAPQNRFVAMSLCGSK